MSVMRPPTILGSSLYVWYRADNAGSSDGDAVATWADQSGNGRDLTQATSGNRPTYKVGIVNGQPVVRFDGTNDRLAHSTASTWTFLHNGSDFGIWIVYKVDGANPELNMNVLDTGGSTAATRGFSLRYDDRSSSSRAHRALVQISSGSSIRATSETVDLGCLSETWHLHEIVYISASAELAPRLDGRLGNSPVQVGVSSLSASAPTSALVVGARNDASQFFDGDIAEIIITNSTTSDDTRRRIYDYLLDRYGMSFWLHDSTIGTVIDDSNHNAFGGFTISKRGRPIASYRRSASGGTNTSVDGKIIVSYSLNGGETFAKTQILAQSGSYDYRESALTTMRNGDIVIAYSRRSTAPANITDALFWGISRDQGETWTTAAITGPFTSWVRQAGPIVELANGDWLLPTYGQDSGDTKRSIKVLASTDSGASWSTRVQLDGDVTGKDYGEAGIVQLANGNLVMLYRESTAPDSWRCVSSSDNGSTWGTDILVTANAEAAPRPLLYGNVIVAACRKNDTTPTADVGCYVASFDSGATWQIGDLLNNPSGTNQRFEYGQHALDPDGGLWFAWCQSASAASTNTDGFMVKAYVRPRQEFERHRRRVPV